MGKKEHGMRKHVEIALLLPFIVMNIIMLYPAITGAKDASSSVDKEHLRMFTEATAVIMRIHIEEHTMKELVAYAIEGMEKEVERKQYEIRKVKLDWEGIGDDRVKALGLFVEAWAFYADATDIPPEELVYGAIRHMVETIDTEASFFTPEDYEGLLATTGGGIGVQCAIRDQVLTVVSPIEGTPAFRAGIQSGDKVHKIDGQPTKGMTLIEAVGKLRGPLGTEVTLTVTRGDDRSFEITVPREMVKIKSVKSRLIDGNIGYVRIVQFQQRTAADLDEHLRKLIEDENITSLIIDLRNNPGGLLNSAVDVTGKFLPEDRLVVYIKDREGRRTEYRTEGVGLAYEMPIVVLVNKGTAAGSEIVAGALRDHNRAIILGSSTFGRASIQSIVPLSNGAGLRLTTSRYYTPKGNSIQSKGIAPDILVELPQPEGIGDLESDTQLQQAVEILLKDAGVEE
jgi:carboxyl-terminal processing protease